MTLTRRPVRVPHLARPSAHLEPRHVAAMLVTLAVLGCRAAEEPEVPPAPQAPLPYELRPLVPGGSPFHGVHGLRFDRNGDLYAVSVIGQSIFKVDIATGDIELVIGPPEGMADDIAIGADGTLVWTAIEDGIVYARSPEGPVRRLVENRRGVNAVSFSPDGERLFVTLVFYGDALLELDMSGRTAPRVIAEDIGGLNAFQVGDDGMIYGPLLFAGRVVRIDPDTGDISTISDEFESPGALKLDSQAAAFVLDEQRVKRVELDTGRTTVVAELPFGADNLALDAEGRLFVSLSEVNAIAEVDVETGEVSYVVEPAPLNSPAGLAVRTEDGRDTLYVGDLFGGVRLVDAETGAVTDTPVDIFQPTHVSLRGDRLLVVGEVFGVVQMLERSGADVLATWEGFTRPGDALEAPNGDVVVAETGSGRVLRIAAGTGDRQVVADGLDAPTGLAWARDGTLYVTETGGGRLLRVDLDTGDTVVEASGLQQPEGVAVDPDGGVLVVEVGAKRLTRILPSDGSQIVIADDLPIGLSNGPSLYRSVAVSSSAIYFNSDVDNTIYRLVPR